MSNNSCFCACSHCVGFDSNKLAKSIATEVERVIRKYGKMSIPNTEVIKSLELVRIKFMVNS